MLSRQIKTAIDPINDAKLAVTRDIAFPHAMIMATFPASFVLILPSILILGLVVLFSLD
ncbi:TPA: hypothetical protein VAM20_002885 [Acinetobacter baumannii]|nr:hypothetical protein [Acinetobacter baumannii]HEO1813612.1 hypothetical protein [Acinetobacter baumannii]